MLVKLRPLDIFGHSASRFDLRLLIPYLDRKEVKRQISRLKIYGRDSNNINLLQLEWRCFACHPEEIPSHPFNFAIMNENHDMKLAYDEEFSMLRSAILREVETQMTECVDIDDCIDEDENDSLSGNEDNDDDYDDDDDDDNLSDDVIDDVSDDEFEAEADHLLAEGNSLVTSMENRQKTCKHRRFYCMNTIRFKDSNLIIRSSLEKATNNLVDNVIQMTSCQATQNEERQETKLCLLPRPKECSCCIAKFHLPTLNPEILEFSRICLGNVKFCDILVTKLPSYPYSLHSLGLERMEAMTQPPPRHFFTNDLRDGELISDESYQQFIELFRVLGMKENKSMMIMYLLIDILSLSLLLHHSSILMARHFELDILQYSTISKYAFEVMIKDATQLTNNDGLEFCPNGEVFDAFNKSIFGGFNSVSSFGVMEKSNFIYQPDFNPSETQRFFLPIDQNSQYGIALCSSLPFSQHEFHGPESPMVCLLNSMLSNAAFLSYLETNFPKKYFLIDVELHYPAQCQDYLVNFVPTMRKAHITADQLSSRQKELAEILNLKKDTTTPMTISDFHDQRGSYSLPYLKLLVALGLQIRQVYSLVISASYPIFKRIIERILELRRLSDDPFSRSWFKLITNSWYELTVDLYMFLL